MGRSARLRCVGETRKKHVHEIAALGVNVGGLLDT